MVRNHKLAKSINDAGWYRFRSWLEYFGKKYKPLIIYVASFEQLQQVTQDVSESTIASLRKIWPGAMSGIFSKKELGLSQNSAKLFPIWNLSLKLVQSMPYSHTETKFRRWENRFRRKVVDNADFIFGEF